MVSKGVLSIIPALTLGAWASWAHAEDHALTANVGLYSQYIFRGMTQTADNPALQGGLDYAHQRGAYLGLWGSNVAWLHDYQGYNSGSLELDLYGGWRGQLMNSINYDLGFIHYAYPGARPAGVIKADTNEVYGALGWRWFTTKLNYSAGKTFGLDTPPGSIYLDLAAVVPVSHTGFTFGAHWGKQEFRGAFRDYGYDDWKFFTSYDLGTHWNLLQGTTVGLMLTGTNARRKLWTDVNGVDMGATRSTVWISHIF